MIALITGATSGIGKATALKLAREGYDVIISGRRCERLENLKKEIENQYNRKVLALCFDVSKREEVEKNLKDLPSQWQDIDVLINNAGLAVGYEYLFEADVDDWETMIDTNIKGLLYVSKFVMPLMMRRNKGHIVNMSSIAGKEVYFKGNVYCATKHAVEALTKAMRKELLDYNIKVSSIAPGKVETEFSLVRFKGDKETADKVYQGYKALQPEDIADLVWFIISRPAHVNIADVLILPASQADSNTIKKNG